MNIQVAGAILRAGHAVTRDKARDLINVAIDMGLSVEDGAAILADWDKHNQPLTIETGP